MKKIAFAALVMLVLILVAKTIGDSRRRSDLEEAEAAARRELREMTIDLLSRKYNAVADWDAQLAKDRNPLKPVLTVELERLWLTERPILFRGVLEDVSIHDDRSYSIELGQTLLQVTPGLIASGLGVRLVADRQQVDDLMRDYPDVVGALRILHSVAVVAAIDSVSAEIVVNGGSATERKVGVGRLLDVVYSGGL